MGKVSARQVQELYGQDVWEAIIASELMLRGSTESSSPRMTGRDRTL